MAGYGEARHGSAVLGRRGKSGRGVVGARHNVAGEARFGVAGYGPVWQARRDLARRGKAWPENSWQAWRRWGKARSAGRGRPGTARRGVARPGEARQAWQGLAEHGRAGQGLFNLFICKEKLMKNTIVIGKGDAIFIAVKACGIDPMIIMIDQIKVTQFGSNKKWYILLDTCIAWWQKESSLASSKKEKLIIEKNLKALMTCRERVIKQIELEKVTPTP